MDRSNTRDPEPLPSSPEDLQAALALAEAIVETVREPIVVLDSEMRVRIANKSFYDTFQVSPPEAERQSLFDLMKRQWNIPKLRVLLEDLLPREGHIRDFQVDHTFEGIGQRVLVLNARQIESGSGGLVLLSIEDATERLRAAEALVISEVRYRRLFETAQDGILLVDPVSRTVFDANPFLTGLLDYTHEEFVGKELWEIGLFKDAEASKAAFRTLQDRGYIRYEDLPLKTRDGRGIEVEFVSNVYDVGTDRVIQCNIRDITERKQTEEMLRRNEALFSALVEQAPVGVYVVDATFRLKQLNPTAQQVFKKVFPLIDRDFAQILRCVWPDRVANGIVKHFRHTLKTGQPYQSPEFTARRRDLGVQEIYEWQIQRVTLPAGEHGVVCFFTNITARKTAEDAQRRLEVLTASNRKLEQEIARRRTVEESLRKSEQHQSRLLVQSHLMQEKLRQLSRKVLWAQEEERKRISRELHDVIAQTLAGINVRLATLKRGVGSNTKDFDRHLAQTQKLVEKSVNIVHQFARELRPAVLDDLGLVPALHSFLKNYTTQTGIRSHLTAFAGIEQLDPTRRTVLFRVAQEALTNVARHAHASRVDVSIQKLPEGICLTVKDAGCSFDVDQALHVNRGKRLGLLGMRERLEMVGGHFEIMSAPGQGTTVTAKIPFGKFRGGGLWRSPLTSNHKLL